MGIFIIFDMTSIKKIKYRCISKLCDWFNFEGAKNILKHGLTIHLVLLYFHIGMLRLLEIVNELNKYVIKHDRNMKFIILYEFINKRHLCTRRILTDFASTGSSTTYSYAALIAFRYCFVTQVTDSCPIQNQSNIVDGIIVELCTALCMFVMY